MRKLHTNESDRLAGVAVKFRVEAREPLCCWRNQSTRRASRKLARWYWLRAAALMLTNFHSAGRH